MTKLSYLTEYCNFAATGSSTNPCKETYHGAAAFSEPESQAVRDFVMSKRGSLKGFISLHSYSQLWLVPYGHQLHTYPDDYHDKLLPVAKKAISKIFNENGLPYKSGTGADLLCKSFDRKLVHRRLLKLHLKITELNRLINC